MSYNYQYSYSRPTWPCNKQEPHWITEATLSRCKISLVPALVSGMWNALRARWGIRHITVAVFWVYIKFPSPELSSALCHHRTKRMQPVSCTSSNEGSGRITVQLLVAGCSIQVPGLNPRVIQWDS